MGKHLRLDRHKSLRAFLSALPSFCWQSGFEILTMVEQLNEDISAEVVKQTVCRLAREGWIDREVMPVRVGKRKTIFKYKGKD